MSELGKRLKSLRLSKNLTLEQLAKIVGVSSKSVVFNWEEDKRNPSKQYLQKYADYFDVSINWIKYGNYKDYVERVIFNAITSNIEKEDYKNLKHSLIQHELQFNRTFLAETTDEQAFNSVSLEIIEKEFLSTLMKHLEYKKIGYDEDKIINELINIINSNDFSGRGKLKDIEMNLLDALNKIYNVVDLSYNDSKYRDVKANNLEEAFKIVVDGSYISNFKDEEAENKAYKLLNELQDNFKKFYEYYTSTVKQIDDQFK